MRVVEISEYGGPEVLRLVDRPDPVAGPGVVVVQIRAASVNAADWKIRSGVSTHGAPLPHVLGRDFSGVVIEAGDGADMAVGDEVFGVCPSDTESAYAGRIAIRADLVTRKPEEVSHVEAAAIALAGLTAMVALQETLALKAGERILIQGGAGGVGSMAVQLARHIGAEVGATARTLNHEYLRGLGADRMIDYRSEDVAAVFAGCDAVLDCVGRAALASTFAVLKPGGRAAFIGMGRAAPAPPRPDVTSLLPDVHRSRSRMERVAALIREGVFSPPQIEEMPMSRVRIAHALSEAGHVRGKIVLIPD